MSKFQKLSLLALRLGMGWLFFYAGVTKITDPAWSAAGYLKNAKTFTGFYEWLASPAVLPLTNFLNEWGLTIIGAALIIGLFTKLGSWLGAILMVLYYFPVLEFPKVGAHSYIVDEHIIYALAFLVLAAFSAGRFWGLEKWCASLPICRRYPKLRSLLG